MITLKQGSFGTYLIVNEDGQDLLVQTDWDRPGIASHFGWDKFNVQASSYSCDHDYSDGTVDCKCGVKVGDFISSATEFLDDNIGAETDDPGWFE